MLINETLEDFMKFVSSQRKDNKDKWVFVEKLVNGRHVKLKFYNTYLQIFTVDNKRKESGTMNMTVKAFNTELLEGLQNADCY